MDDRHTTSHPFFSLILPASPKKQHVPSGQVPINVTLKDTKNRHGEVGHILHMCVSVDGGMLHFLSTVLPNPTPPYHESTELRFCGLVSQLNIAEKWFGINQLVSWPGRSEEKQRIAV